MGNSSLIEVALGGACHEEAANHFTAAINHCDSILRHTLAGQSCLKPGQSCGFWAKPCQNITNAPRPDSCKPIPAKKQKSIKSKDSDNIYSERMVERDMVQERHRLVPAVHFCTTPPQFANFAFYKANAGRI
ncbi:hypothetical protein DEU56DRAFT_759886 [Suillus clintonianus]|uniref:uncharacterized protein n=1 Tax=Suillus clintonianus TaxID=1904413 RepID=UPI001B882BB9|nr:uncharacterized protein DEU56DRAFT_759886 [Suillus clintonianus]KAG2123855.1 hypothetical protein DEU56DRAFT_759886 [Suillus clintonianus]